MRSSIPACAATALRGHFVFCEEFFEGWLRVQGIGDADLTLAVGAVSHLAEQGVIYVEGDVGTVCYDR